VAAIFRLTCGGTRVALELARSMSLYATMSLADGVVDPVIA
jgi:hypothetical protein